MNCVCLQQVLVLYYDLFLDCEFIYFLYMKFVHEKKGDRPCKQLKAEYSLQNLVTSILTKVKIFRFNSTRLQYKHPYIYRQRVLLELFYLREGSSSACLVYKYIY